jgi:hypothetical protein
MIRHIAVRGCEGFNPLASEREPLRAILDQFDNLHNRAHTTTKGRHLAKYVN